MISEHFEEDFNEVIAKRNSFTAASIVPPYRFRRRIPEAAAGADA